MSVELSETGTREGRNGKERIMGLFSTIGGFAAGYIVGARRRPAPSSPQTGALVVPPVDTRRVSEIMTASPKTLPSNAMLIDAAKMMAADDIGDVIVTDPSSNAVSGIITDRDIVIRAIAKGLDPATSPIEGSYSPTATVVAPHDLVQEASFLMRDEEVRRLPVVEEGRAVGIVSLGDLAAETEQGTVLASMNEAPPDH
jgi:CBS domain-containing protein